MTESQIKRERSQWIDALKGFAIFCVTLGHCNIYSPIEKYIYSFHMFLFFFLSGFLFSDRQNSRELIKKRTKRILVPFLTWNIISCILAFIFDKDISNFVEELFVINGNLTWNPAIWFLLVMFISQMLCLIFRLHINVWISIISVAVSLFVWTLMGHKSMLWKLNLVPMALAFFLIGFLLKNYLPVIGKRYIYLPAGAIGFIFAMINIRIVYTYGKFGNYIYCIVSAIGSILFFVGLFSKIKSFRALHFLIEWGQNSMLIMAFQFFIFKALSFISINLLNFNIMEYKNSTVALLIALFTVITINGLVIYIRDKSRSKKCLRFFCELLGITY